MEVITRQNKNLLLKSKICLNDIELKEFLLSLPQYKGVKDEDLDSLKMSNERLYFLLKSDDTREAIVNNSFNKWTPKRHIGEEPFPCELCGCPSSKDKYVITNTETKLEYKIGSSCIDRFPVEARLENGNDILKTRNWTKEQLDKSAEFYRIHKTGRIIFNKWTEKYNNLNLLMPSTFDDKFKRILKTGKTFYKNFINNTLPEGKTINTFKYIMIDFNTFYKDCIKYIDDNKNNNYICNKDMVIGVDNDIVSRIKGKDTCKVDTFSSKYIINVDFINKFKQNIIVMFKRVDLNLKDISSDGIEIGYKYRRYNELSFIIPLRKFAKNYSDIYFTDKFDVNLNQALNDCTLANTFENVNRFLDIIQSILKNNKIYFRYNQKLHSQKIIEINRRNDKKYAVLDFDKVLNEYIQVFALSEDNARGYLSSAIDNLNWISKKEKEKFDIGSISQVYTTSIRDEDEKQYSQYESEKEYYERIKKAKKNTIKIK
ncbi:hypothetical protein [Clostridium sp. ZBS18]|uniref:hypothetical protein n=1 Tax=Clostridium sp. ZBS18 TaxID=2949967 RepID=UPI0020793489|nr:hypothetical protein [Clostridium sp. ZBS18]